MFRGKQAIEKWHDFPPHLFPVLQGSAETPLRRGGKLYHLSTGYIPRNTPAKNINIQRRIVEFVDVGLLLAIAKRSGIFFTRHSVYLKTSQPFRGRINYAKSVRQGLF